MSISLGVKLKKLRFSCLALAGILVASLFISVLGPILTYNLPAANAQSPNINAIKSAKFSVSGNTLTLLNGSQDIVDSIGNTWTFLPDLSEGGSGVWRSNQNRYPGTCPKSVMVSNNGTLNVYTIGQWGGLYAEDLGDAEGAVPNARSATGQLRCGAYIAGGTPLKYTQPQDNDGDNPPGGNNGNNGGNDGGDQGGNTDKQKDCEHQGGVLGFILCFVVEQLFNVLNVLHEQAVKYLHFTLIAPDDQFGLKADQYNQAKSSWLFVSRLADVWLAIAFILMIIGTAVTNFLDAYSVKKILPRLVIAIIAVNLSWYICTFALEIGNVLGAGIRDIILSPFQGGKNAAMVNMAIPGGGTVDFIGVLGIAGGFAALFIPGVGGFMLLSLMSIIVPAVMTILLGFLLIIARQGLLLLLTIVSPLAFSLWVLPGTEGIFRRWQRLFATLVIFYPIFQAILAIGIVVAIITTSR